MEPKELIKDYEVPKGYKLVKIKDPKEDIQKEIDMIETTIGEPPTDVELIKEGRVMHPYYIQKERLDYLKDKLGVD